MSKPRHDSQSGLIARRSHSRRRLRTPFIRILLPVLCVVFASMACDEPWDTIEYITTGKWPATPTQDTSLMFDDEEEYPCWEDGESIKYTGGFDPIPDNPWVPFINTILLQFNTMCTDVYGYADLNQQVTSLDRTETGTNRISFKGTFNPKTGKFEGTVFVDHDVTCQGACEGYLPYSFDYPAAWNGSHDEASGTVTGWIDGIGNFKLTTSVVIGDKAYKEVPGLDIWP